MHRLLDSELVGVAALPLAGLLTAGSVVVSAICEAAAGASKVPLPGPAATVYAKLQLEDLGSVATKHVSSPSRSAEAVVAADSSALANLPMAVAVAALQAVLPVCDSTAAAARHQNVAHVAAAHSNHSTSEDSARGDGGSNNSGSDADSAASQCSASSSGLIGQLWDAADADQQAAALKATPSIRPLLNEPASLHSASGVPGIADASAPEQLWHDTRMSKEHSPSNMVQNQQRQQAATLPVQRSVTSPQQAACHSCDAQLRRRGSRKQETSRRKQAAAARRAEFMVAWRLAVWRSEQEKHFTAQLEVGVPMY